MANPAVGYITREALCAALPERIEIRKSGKKNPRFSLYLGTPFGPWQMNTPAAQEVLLEQGAIYGPEGAPAPDPAPEPDPAPHYLEAMPAPIREIMVPEKTRIRETPPEDPAPPVEDTPPREPEAPARRGWLSDLEEPF